MRSKTRRTSKNTVVTDKSVAQSLAVGHQPVAALGSRQDEALFRAFQSNLLSLISHELRTPLTGVLNALNALEEGTGSSGLTQAELVKMARQNAERLHRSLVALLDLASLESGTFHARLKEVDLLRLVQVRIQENSSRLKDSQLKCDWDVDTQTKAPILLADAQKLGRALDLCFQALIPRAKPQTQVKVRISSRDLRSHSIQISFELAPGMEQLWDDAWSQSRVAYEGGLASPYSAFAGVVQSEKAFLTRVEEGLGSEFLLIHEIMRLHGGKFHAVKNQHKVNISLDLQALNSEAGLRSVLNSRVFQVSTELGSVALILIQVPSTVGVEAFCQEVKGKLFRTTDAVYPLTERQQIALVLDDCKVEDAPKLMTRISQAMKRELPFGTAHCPSDGLDPEALLELAEDRLKKK